jgi:hypothetical protein
MIRPRLTAQRLIRLEQELRPVGCATCRYWMQTVIEDGEGNRSRPERCPGCGRLVPIRMIRRIIGVPLDWI